MGRNPESVQRYLHEMFFTITSIAVYQSDTSQGMSTEYNTPTPVQSHWTDTKYNTILILIQVQFCEKSHSPKTPILKLCAFKFPSEEKYEAREGDGA